MNYFERIPVRTEGVALTGEITEINCNGLEASLFADGSDVLIKADTAVSDDCVFILKNGERINLNGRFFVKADSGSLRVLYCRIV